MKGLTTTTVLTALLAVACQSGDAGEETSPEEARQVIKLQISTATDPAKAVQLGTLTFNGQQPPVLTLASDGPQAQKLSEDWSSISSRPTLMLDQMREGVRDGERVTEHVSQVVAPDDEDYPWAVMAELMDTYGYEVESEESDG